jgi:hypothetical protein
MIYKYLVLKSEDEICRLSFDYIGQREKVNRYIVNNINKFFSSDKEVKAVTYFNQINLLCCDNMYLEDSEKNLISLNDYVSLARMIGCNKEEVLIGKYFSYDKLNNYSIDVIDNPLYIKSQGCIRLRL